MEIGRLQRVPLRELWKNEALDFTAWLAENIDVLSDALDIELSVLEREKDAGAFAVDILASDSNGRIVVIENQIEKTDHDHLGKVLTYLTNLEAKTAIWVSSDPRPEHARAVAWLNESTPDDVSFYLVRLDAYRIGESSAAPHFSVIVGPSDETKEIGQQKKVLAKRHHDYLEFWKQLLEKAKTKTDLHTKISPGTESWITASAGRSGLGFAYVILMDDARVELYITRASAEENKAIFDQLFAQREETEKAFGGPLKWERLDGKRASRISASLGIGGLSDADRWASVQEAMIDAMMRLHKGLKGLIDALKI